MLLVATVAAAVLDGQHVAVGVNDDGSFVEAYSSVGLLFAPDGDVVGQDLLLPGRAYEAWAVSWDGGQVVQSAPDGGSDLVLAFDEVEVGADASRLVGVAETDELRVTQEVGLRWSGRAVVVRTLVEALEPLSDVWVSRSFDPDPDAMWGDYDSDNHVEEGYVAGGGVEEARAMGLVSLGAEGGSCSWCVLASDLRAGDTEPGVADVVLGLAREVGDLAAGEAVEVVFVYGFAADADEAVAVALDELEADDLDGDGVVRDEDCDELDASVHPGAAELADGIDQDCDGEVDEDSPGSDDDGDGWTEAEGDCDDSDPDAWPGGPGDDCSGSDEAWDEDGALGVTETTETVSEAEGCSSGGSGLWLLALAAAWRRGDR